MQFICSISQQCSYLSSHLQAAQLFSARKWGAWGGMQKRILPNFTKDVSLDGNLTVLSTNTSLWFLWSFFLRGVGYHRDPAHNILFEGLAGWWGISDSPGWGTVWLTNYFIAECETQRGNRLQDLDTPSLIKKVPSVALTIPKQLAMKGNKKVPKWGHTLYPLESISRLGLDLNQVLCLKYAK